MMRLLLYTTFSLIHTQAVPISASTETQTEAKFLPKLLEWLGGLADMWSGKLGKLDVIAENLDLDNELDILTDTVSGWGDGADKLAKKIRKGKKERKEKRKARRAAREAAARAEAEAQDESGSITSGDLEGLEPGMRISPGPSV